ncbi:MAG TPA: multiubiquitin domain-containing protein [Terriglobia bacterium]|nr:multiubiquitin domain-containing protein [Terriglobia bacterium]
MQDAELKSERAIEHEIEEVEIELFAKRGERPPRAKRYVIRVDKQKFVVHTETITGAEILALDRKSQEKFKLYEHKRGHQPILIGPNDPVHLCEHGVERFTTMPKDTTEGVALAVDLRHEFQLPVADEEYLNGLGLPWETVKDNGTLWLFIHQWSVPAGYSAERVSLALLIPEQYSDAQIDMVYLNPALARTDARPIMNLAGQSICGATWQRWSRHRTQQNPWRPGVDDVAGHLALVDEWLRRELGG